MKNGRVMLGAYIDFFHLLNYNMLERFEKFRSRY